MNIGGGADLSYGDKAKRDEDGKKVLDANGKVVNETGLSGGLSSASLGFSDSRQTNFATIGEGTIIVRDGNTDLSNLNRDVTKAQYGTTDLEVQLSVDKSTINAIMHPIETYQDTVDGLTQIEDRGRKIEEQTHIVEKTGNLIEYKHFTTDDKVQYCLNMDDYEALKEAGGEITALDTLVYVKSKSAAGYELDRSDMSDLNLASGFVIDDATNGIRENLETNIRVNSREDVNASLAVLDRFDSEDAAAARGYLLGVRTEGYYSQQLETNSSLRNMELGQYDETERIYKDQNTVNFDIITTGGLESIVTIGGAGSIGGEAQVGKLKHFSLEIDNDELLNSSLTIETKYFVAAIDKTKLIGGAISGSGSVSVSVGSFRSADDALNTYRGDGWELNATTPTSLEVGINIGKSAPSRENGNSWLNFAVSSGVGAAYNCGETKTVIPEKLVFDDVTTVYELKK